MNTSNAVTFRANYARLRNAQKPGTGAPLYSLLVNRPLGRIFAAAAHRLGLRPNQVTTISALFTFTGMTVLAVGAPGWVPGVLVAGLLLIGYALDSADGQLARLRGGGTLTGEWLDHLIDAAKVAALHLAVLIMFYRLDLPDWWLLVAIAFAITDIVHFFGMLLTELLSRSVSHRLVGGPSAAARGGNLFTAVLKLPTDYGVVALSFLLLAVPVAFQWLYLFLALTNLAYLILVLGVWYRRLDSLDARLREPG